MKRKEMFTLFSDHNWSLLRRQSGALTKVQRERKSPRPKVDQACSVWFCLSSSSLVIYKRKNLVKCQNRVFMFGHHLACRSMLHTNLC